MAKTIYTCRECGGTNAKWLGQCPHCKAWNTLDETVADGVGTLLAIVTDSVEANLGADRESWSGSYSATVADPDGHVWQVIAAEGHSKSGDGADDAP